MVKVTISYTERKELQKILELLKPHTLKVKRPETVKGVYKKAYVTLNM